MDNAAILAKVDHTLLKPESTWADIKKLCDEAMEYHTASVCINPCCVKQAAEYMKGAVLPSGRHRHRHQGVRGQDRH